MGKNKSRKIQSENNSGKWENRFNKTIEVTGKVVSVAGTILTTYAAYKGIKNSNNSKN